MNKNEALDWLRQHGDERIPLRFYEQEDSVTVSHLFQIFHAAMQSETQAKSETCLWATSITDATEWVTSCTRWYRKTFHSTSGICPNCGRVIEVQP